MSLLQTSQGTPCLSDTKTLKTDRLNLRASQSWVFVGSNGNGKSALARALAGNLTLLSGQHESHFSRVTRLSFEQLQKLVSDEWRRNNTGLLSPGEEDTGCITAETIQDEVKDPACCARPAEQFGTSALLDRRLKYLSIGETRKTLLRQALMVDPQLLILDELFGGLDVNSHRQLAALLADSHRVGIILVLVLNRFGEVPEFTRFTGVLADCTLSETDEKSSLLQQALVAQLVHSEEPDDITLPEPDIPPARHALVNSAPCIVLNDGVVSYNDCPVINHLSWTVNPGEHQQIVGPNGAGKSTLLNLITDDHPQGYSNDLALFGRRRGSGETIRDIKKCIGYVSSSLHLDYRVSTNVRNVILSGYFDSIGVYQTVSDKRYKLVQQWLDILGIDKHTVDAPFHSLSWGQQRLALIVRALVKHPTLPILDKPLQGLGPLNRQLVRRFIDALIGEGATQLLFVSHHAKDAPDCITHRLAFVPSRDGYTYQLGSMA